MRVTQKITYLIILTIISSCEEKLPDVYYKLNYCDTCITIGGAIEYEQQHNSARLTTMPEEYLYESIYHNFDSDYYVRLNKGTHKKHIYTFKYFMEIDTIFKLKVLKVYKYLYEENEDSLLNRLAINEIKVKIFHTDPILDSLYKLPQFTECKYDSLKAVFDFLEKKYDKYFKEKCGKHEGQRKLSRETYPNTQKYPLIKDMNAYYNACDDFGIGIEMFYNIPKEGKYEEYKNLSPEDMSIYLDKVYYHKNNYVLKEAGYIL